MNRSSAAIDQTTLLHRRSVSRDAPRWMLRVLCSPDLQAEGQVRVLEEEHMTLGRHPATEDGWTIMDPYLSRRHLRIGWDPQPGRPFLQDAGSRGGSYRNGARIGEGWLAPGDVLRLGDTILLVSVRSLRDLGWTAPRDSALQGSSPSLHTVLDEIRQVAPSELAVLVLGETGTGKEEVARELHRVSGRTGEFVACNAAAIPTELAESMLFGHVKGAFTGATEARKGLLRQAEGGTFFLDEVGELSPMLQAKLLRVLNDRAVRAVGGLQEQPVDLRFVFATLSDLETAPGFRRDLLARMRQWTIHLAPLRERPEDLLPIVRSQIAAAGPGRDYTLSGDFFEALALHNWPENVRELVAVMQEAFVRLPRGGLLGLEQLRPALRGQVAEREPGPVVPAQPEDEESKGVYRATEPDPCDAAPQPSLSGREAQRSTEIPELPASASEPAGTDLPPAPPPGATPERADVQSWYDHFRGNQSAIARHTQRDRQQVRRWLKRYGLDRDPD